MASGDSHGDDDGDDEDDDLPATSKGPPPSSPTSTEVVSDVNPPSTTSSSHDDSKSAPCESIGAFVLGRDVEPQGHRIIIPFLTNKDLLRLSECSKGLLPSRLHLTRIRLRYPYYTKEECSPRIKGGVLRLLAEQMRGLEYLHIDNPLVLPMLQSAADIGGCSVKALNLSYKNPKLTDNDHLLGSILLSGGLQDVEELDSTQAPQIVTYALAQGACPGLRKLCVVPTSILPTTGQRACDSIATAMESGYCQGLEELVVMIKLNAGGFAFIARALRASHCPNLVKLDVSHSIHTVSDWQILEQFLRSPASQRLQVLRLHGNSARGAHVIPVIEALESGNCPELMELGLARIGMTVVAANALARMLTSGRLPQLQSLDLKSTPNRVAILRLLEGLRGGTIPNLRHIDLTECGMDERHGRALGEALQASVFPLLEDLCIHRNKELGDEGVRHVMQALEGGGCPNMKRLVLWRTGIGSAAANAWGRAVKSGSMGQLQELSFGFTESSGMRRWRRS